MLSLCVLQGRRMQVLFSLQYTSEQLDWTFLASWSETRTWPFVHLLIHSGLRSLIVLTVQTCVQFCRASISAGFLILSEATLSMAIPCFNKTIKSWSSSQAYTVFTRGSLLWVKGRICGLCSCYWGICAVYSGRLYILDVNLCGGGTMNSFSNSCSRFQF